MRRYIIIFFLNIVINLINYLACSTLDAHCTTCTTSICSLCTGNRIASGTSCNCPANTESDSTSDSCPGILFDYT